MDSSRLLIRWECKNSLWRRISAEGKVVAHAQEFLKVTDYSGA